jgi:hypothetical protein
MRKDPHPQRRELIENIGQQCPIMDLEVEAGLSGQSHDFPQDEPHTFDEERVDEGVYHLRMRIPRMLLKHHLVLHEEMRDVVLQIDPLADGVDTDHLSSAFDRKTHQLRRCTQDGITQVGLDLATIDCLGEKGRRLGKITQDGPSHCDFLIEERILMVDVQAVLEGRVFVSRHLDEVSHEGVLRDCEGLGDDDVVPLGKEGKCELDEI